MEQCDSRVNKESECFDDAELKQNEICIGDNDSRYSEDDKDASGGDNDSVDSEEDRDASDGDNDGVDSKDDRDNDIVDGFNEDRDLLDENHWMDAESSFQVSYMLSLNFQMEINDEMFKPLYGGSNISVCGAYCASMHFKSSCRVSFSTMSELLKLLQLLCPVDNKLPKTVYVFRKFFERFSADKEVKQFCPSCHEEINGKYQNTNCLNEEPDSYICVDMKRQMHTILSCKLSNININFFYLSNL